MHYTQEYPLPKPSCCDRGVALLGVFFSTPDYLCDVLLSYSPLSPALNRPGSALSRWLYFAKHSCFACECKTTTMQLQKNVFFGLPPLCGASLAGGGGIWGGGGVGIVLLYCQLLRHQEGKDEITPAALPLLTASLCAKRQHLRWLSHRATLRCKQRRRKAFVVSFPVFYLEIHPRGELRALHIP